MNLIDRAQLIRNETTAGANTAERLGELLEQLAGGSTVLDTIADLKAHEAEVGEVVYVRNHSHPDDEGGGLFRLVDKYDFMHRDISLTFGPGNNTNLLLDEVHKSWRAGDRVKWQDGSIVEITTTSGTGFGSSFISPIWETGGTVGANHTAWYMPAIEGIRVIPTHASVPANAYWERVGSDQGSIKLEWLGARKSGTTLEFDKPCQDYFNYAMARGYSIELDAGLYYISDSINQIKSTAVIGKGYGGREFITHTLTQPDDRNGTTIFTNQNIDLVNIRMMYTTWQDICFDCTRITPTHNGTTYHDKFVLNYDLSYRVEYGQTYRCKVVGNQDALNVPSMGTNYIRYNSDDAVVVSGAGHAYFMKHVGDVVMRCNIGHKIDEDNGAQNTDTACIYCDIDMSRVKQAYRWLDGTTNYITGTYIQDGACLPFEERNTPLFYFRVGSTIIDVGTGDHVHGIDPAETEGASTRDYPSAHVTQLLYDIGDGGNIDIRGGAFRNRNDLGTPARGRVFNGMNPSRDHTYSPQIIWSSKRDNPVKISGLTNMFRDADILQTVRTGLLAGGGGFDFEANTVEQNGVLGTATNLSYYLSTILAPLFRFSGGRVAGINWASGADTTNDFFEVVVDFGSSTNISSIYISSEGFDRVQVIQYNGDSEGTGGIYQRLYDNVPADRLLLYNPNGSAFKYTFRFIGKSGGGTGLTYIHDIFGYSNAIAQNKVPPFIQRGMSPVMQSPDGTWWVLNAPTNSGGDATWTQL